VPHPTDKTADLAVNLPPESRVLAA
jgi:hypothetical protein